MMAGASSLIVAEAEWQDVTALLRPEFPGVQALELFAQSVRLPFAEEGMHVFLHHGIAQPRIDPVIVEKEDAVAAPTADYGVDQP